MWGMIIKLVFRIWRGFVIIIGWSGGINVI